MLRHQQVWDGIDKLAARNRLSASALAKRAGLDPTTFNKSKRTTKQGKARWPSTESISKILDATGTAMADFVSLMIDVPVEPRPPQRLRTVAVSQIEGGDEIDASGFLPQGKFEEVDFPSVEDENAYVVELDRDIAAPIYRIGDHLVVAPSSGIRRGDRVIGRSKDGTMIFGVLVRRTTQRVVIQDLKTHEERAMAAGDVAWIARIVWVSQ